MFRIIDSKGFHISFSNGWTISVQFGAANYCSHYDDRDWDAPKKAKRWESPDAEVAFWYERNSIIDVEGWQSPLQVADLITLLSTDPAPFYFGA